MKWRDYDDVTAEPVSSIVRDTRGDPDILRQIQEDPQGFPNPLLRRRKSSSS